MSDNDILFSETFHGFRNYLAGMGKKLPWNYFSLRFKGIRGMSTKLFI